MSVYPSILTESLAVAIKQLNICKESNAVNIVQIDIIDGYFTDNLTIFPSDMADLDFGELTLDFHLMTHEPIDFVREIKDHKNNLPVRAIIAQVEQMGSQSEFLDEVKHSNWKTGLSLNLDTPLEAIEPDSWEFLNIVQIMAIQAGFQGQKMQERVLSKIESLQEIIDQRGLEIEVIVDGGVKLENIEVLKSYGVDGVAVGSELWQSSDFVETYTEFENALS
jgi:ribulose-phosphate 3-epimerase